MNSQFPNQDLKIKSLHALLFLSCTFPSTRTTKCLEHLLGQVFEVMPIQISYILPPCLECTMLHTPEALSRHVLLNKTTEKPLKFHEHKMSDAETETSVHREYNSPSIKSKY